MRDQAERFHQHQQDKQAAGKGKKKAHHESGSKATGATRELRKTIAAIKIQSFYRGHVARKRIRLLLARN